jgi:geranylgeranyl reductase family protein
VVVSGAGPAGARSANLCARAGLRTLLLERESIPREKCCAGGLLQRAAGLLDEELPDRVIEHEVRSVGIIHRDFSADFDLPTRAAVTVRRSAFDAHLAEKAQKAGAELWCPCSISRVAERSGGVEMTAGGRAITSKALIVAEGATSRTASVLFGPYPGDHQGIGLSMTCRLERDPGGRMEFHFMDTPIGRYPFTFKFPLNGWMFATKGGANIGVAAKDLGGARYRAALDDLRANVEARYGEASEARLSAHPIPMVPRRRLNTKRCLLVGDAAGFASPLSGEGMTNAFKSAVHAADAVHGMIARSRPLSDYRRGIAKDVLPIIRASRVISPQAQWLIGVVDTPVLMKKMQDDPELVSTCLGISNGERNWEALLRLIVRKFPYLFFSSLT